MYINIIFGFEEEEYNINIYTLYSDSKKENIILIYIQYNYSSLDYII
jgi:hypothetical protein